MTRLIDKIESWGPVWFVCLSFLMIVLLTGCVALDQRDLQELEAAYGAHPPLLKDTFASKIISPGDDWFIYLKGYDPDGDIKFIHVWLEVPSRPTTPQRILVDLENSSRISGYLYLDTDELGGDFSQYFNGWLRVMVALEDRAGHRSNTGDHVLYFRQGAVASRPEAGRFEERFLGKIPPELFPFGPEGPGGVDVGTAWP